MSCESVGGFEGRLGSCVRLGRGNGGSCESGGGDGVSFNA